MGKYVFIFLLPCSLYGQDIPFLEALIENTGGGELADVLSTLPVSVNVVSEEQLRAMQILDDQQIRNLIEYRNTYGRILSKYELQAVNGFGPVLIGQLEKFLIMDEEPFKPDIGDGAARRGRLEFTALTAHKSGVKGSHLRSRTKWNSGDNYEIGIRTDHDAGEPFRFAPAGSHWLFDHVNLYLRYSSHNSEVVAGNYRIHFGQGLMHNGAFRLGKGALLPLPAANSFITPYGTFQESGGLWGVAALLRKKRLKLIMHSSFKREDASIQEDGSFGSISGTGIHRSAAELARRKRLGIFTTGILAEMQWANAVIGIGLNADRTSHPLRRRFYYSSVLPEGHITGQISMHGRYRYRNILAWSETVLSGQAAAVLTGVSVALDREVEWLMLYRRYSPAYFSWHGQGFSESSGTRNESGLYMGLHYFRKKKFDITAYVDVYHFPWFGYQRNNAVRGRDARLDLTILPRKSVKARLIHSREWRDEGRSDEQSGITRHKYQLHISHQRGRNEFRFRAQTNSVSGGRREQGFLLAADIIFNRNRSQWNGRLMYYSTPSYDSREFISERDVWGSFSLPSYHGRGWRTVWMLRLKAGGSKTIWIRYANTCSLPEYRFRHEIKLQFKIVM